MMIDCISDLHGNFPDLAGGDILIVAGGGGGGLHSGADGARPAVRRGRSPGRNLAGAGAVVPGDVWGAAGPGGRPRRRRFVLRAGLPLRVRLQHPPG